MAKKGKAYRLLDSKLRKYLAEQSKKWDPKKSWRWPSVCYTLEHKLAYLEREHYLTGTYSLRGIFHDWDKPCLYLCPWLDENEVQKKHRYNRPHHVEVYAEVLDVLKRISNTFYYKEWALNVKKSYDLGKKITQFKPEEIFVLVLMWHSEKMGFELDFTLANGISEQVYCEMKTHTHFTNSGVSILNHCYNEVKPSSYRV